MGLVGCLEAVQKRCLPKMALAGVVVGPIEDALNARKL